MHYQKILLVLILFFSTGSKERPFIVGQLGSQLGNNMFQIAAVCAYAWDHDLDPYFPDLTYRQMDGMQTNKEHVFFRLNPNLPPKAVKATWVCPEAFKFCYHPIPYLRNKQIGCSTFQSEKYFAHHRDRILQIFAPHPDDLNYIQQKYSHIINHPNSVGVQVRWFGITSDLIWKDIIGQYGYDYFNKAMALFPEDTLFIIGSNNAAFAKENIPTWPKNVIFLNEPYYIELAILSLCKHQIISNSTFGWWAAWLNQNPEKIVIRPKNWLSDLWESNNQVDVYPKEWHMVEAKMGNPADPINSFRE